MIKINDEYYIEADTNNYMLKQVHYVEKINHKSDGTDESLGIYRQDLVIGYYATIDMALKGYLKHKSRDIVSKKDFESIQEYLKYIEKLDKELDKLKLNI